MADNLAVTPGAGATILADEVTHATFGTGIVGITKLMDGAVGGTALIGGDATNGLDVDVTRVSGTVTISGTVTSNAGTNLNTSALALESGGNLAACATSLAIMDDWDSSDRCKVIDEGPAAADAAVTGNPVQVAGRGSRARPTAMSADSDVTLPWLDRYGSQVSVPVFQTVVSGQATASGDTTIIAAPGSGSRLRIFRIEASNSHATVAVTVGFKSTSVNSGSVFGKRYLPAVGGALVTQGCIICGDNELLAINLSAGSTTIEWTVYYDVVAN